MIYIVTALPCEATPIVKKYDLKRDDACRHFTLYRGDDMFLIVSGVGKMASAIATAYLIAQNVKLDEAGAEEGLAIINIGVCGTLHQRYPIGTPLLIHKVIDHETGKQYFPDILIEHPFEEGSIETHNDVVRREDVLSGRVELQADLVDMEASGFFQAASRFLAPHQIYVIKVVGDYLDVVDFDRQRVAQCISGALDAVDGFIKQVEGLCRVEGEVLTPDERRQLEKVKESLRLTVTQSHQLVDMARRYKLRTGRPLPDLSEFAQTRVKVKVEGRKALERIRRLLLYE
jgi:nucleoside phosphorylase